MNREIQKLLLCVVLMLTGQCLAADDSPTDIDALTASPANFTLLLENDHVRVLEYVVLPGEQDQWHTHPQKMSYVVRGGTLRIHLEDGTSFLSEEAEGSAVWMDALPRHYAENVGDTPVQIILVEVK